MHESHRPSHGLSGHPLLTRCENLEIECSQKAAMKACTVQAYSLFRLVARAFCPRKRADLNRSL